LVLISKILILYKCLGVHFTFGSQRISLIIRHQPDIFLTLLNSSCSRDEFHEKANRAIKKFRNFLQENESTRFASSSRAPRPILQPAPFAIRQHSPLIYPVEACTPPPRSFDSAKPEAASTASRARGARRCITTSWLQHELRATVTFRRRSPDSPKFTMAGETSGTSPGRQTKSHHLDVHADSSLRKRSLSRFLRGSRTVAPERKATGVARRRRRRPEKKSICVSSKFPRGILIDHN
jgi:hypothetical protein